MFVRLSICSNINKTWKDDVSWQCAVIFKAAVSYISESTLNQMTPCKNQQTKSMPVPIKLRAAAHINWLNIT